MDLEKRAEELRSLLTQYQRAYYTTGRSLVPDIEYDRLFDELKAIEDQNPNLVTQDSPTQRVGSDLSSDFPEVEHTIPVLSLDKAYSTDEIYSFIDKTVKSVSDTNLSFVLEEKIDGFSIVLYYRNGVLEKAVTRGNGAVGNDVTNNVKTIHAVPLRLTENVTIAVRGEIYLPKNDFEKINSSLSEPYANPRNLAAGTIRRIKSSETARVPLSIFCYEGFWEDETPFTDHIQILSCLKKLGFCVDPHLTYFCRTQEEAEKRLKEADLEGKAMSFDQIPQEVEERTRLREKLSYEIDGLVLKVNELVQRDKLGYTEHHPRWAIAYKFESPQAQSVVENIDVQVGRTGRITPMARIKPTELSGSVISNVTLHNQDYVDQLEIAKGDTVAISKRGDVIPAVESVLEKNNDGNTTWKMPSFCPVCSAPIEKRGAHHFCTNKNCPSQEKGRLEFFCAKKQMDIEGLGPKTIEILYDNKYIRTILDLYKFDFKTLVRDNVEGFGNKKVETIEKGISDSKNAPFSKLLASLGLNEFSHKAIELVFKAGFDSYQKLEDLIKDKEVAQNTLSSIDGIGEVIAKEIVENLSDEETQTTLKAFKEIGFILEERKPQNTEELEQTFEGQSWCVTGTFENFQPRDRAMDEIKKRGGVEVTSVSSKTYALLAGKNAGSKLAKAQSLGIKIVNEEEFMKMIHHNAEQNEQVKIKETELQQELPWN